MDNATFANVARALAAIFLLAIWLTLCAKPEANVTIPDVQVNLPAETIRDALRNPPPAFPWLQLIYVGGALVALFLILRAIGEAVNEVAKSIGGFFSALIEGVTKLVNLVISVGKDAPKASQLLSAVGVASAGVMALKQELGEYGYLLITLVAFLSLVPLILHFAPRGWMLRTVLFAGAFAGIAAIAVLIFSTPYCAADAECISGWTWLEARLREMPPGARITAAFGLFAAAANFLVAFFVRK